MSDQPRLAVQPLPEKNLGVLRGGRQVCWERGGEMTLKSCTQQRAR